MAEEEGIALDHFRVLMQRAGLNLSDEELVALKPMYDFYTPVLQRLHEVTLGMEDLAVTFTPSWDPDI